MNREILYQMTDIQLQAEAESGNSLVLHTPGYII